MKILKILLAVLVSGACAASAHAQKQLEYVPKAFQGIKEIPAAVNPKLPAQFQTWLAVPVTRPNVSTAVERQVAAKVTVEDRIKRLETNLPLLEEYVRTHGNKLPQTYSGAEGSDLRWQVIADVAFLEKYTNLATGRLWVERYARLLQTHKQQHRQEQQVLTEQRRKAREEQREQKKLAEEEQHRQEVAARAKQREQARQDREQQQRLNEQFIQELRAQEQAAQERAWQEVLLQDKSWKAQPEDIVVDPAENAEAAATLAEEQWVFPIAAPTDEYIDYLLRFYNKLDPYGTGTIQ